jgi:hypothetical protein
MVLAAVGIGLFVFGGAWAPFVLESLPDTEAGFWVELVVPFLPMVFIGFAAVLFVRIRR